MHTVRYLLLPVAAAIIFTLAPVAARAQLPSLATPSSAPSLFVTQPIVIDGSPVLRVSAPANPSAGATPIASRVFLINGAIQQILAIDPDTGQTVYDPKTFKVAVQKEGSEYALVAGDAKHRPPLPILTVTSADARNANTTQAQLAQQWQSTLQTALQAALQRRQPAALHRSRSLLISGGVALVLITAIGFWFFRTSKKRVAAAVVAWVLAILWAAAITYALYLFPATISYGRFVVRAAIRVGVIIVAAIVMDFLLGIVVNESVRALARFGVTPGSQSRSLLRVPTMSRAIGGFKRFLIIFIAVLAALSVLQIPIASVVTIGGIAALAVGFAAQSLVRDFLNGLLVLFEDQYVVGDYVAVGAFNGVVEQLTLRILQLRDNQGNLITIPHSSVTQVVNASRNWSRIDYQIALDAGADLRKGVDTLKAVLDGLKADEEWSDAVIEPYEWIGVENVSKSSYILRAIVRTAPARQFELRREINMRVVEAFAKEQVPLGVEAAPALISPLTQSPNPT